MPETSLEEEVGKIALSDDAPEVDLDVLVVENCGINVQFDSQLGRATIASKDFATMHVPILRETPALICNSNDYVEFMEKFLDTEEQIQVGILDMFYQPLNSPMGRSLVEPARVLYLLGVLEDVNVIHQLLAIYCTNSYQYQGSKLSAILIYGSKFAHSCHPNIGYSSMSSAEEGVVDYHVIRPIKKDDQVCTSYLSDLYETPTSERRNLLLATKSFLCRCERCNGPDYCRVLPCSNRDCKKPVPCQYDTETLKPFWQCNACKCESTDSLIYVSLERVLSKTLDTIEQAIQKQQGFDAAVGFSPQMISEVVDECASTLSPCHYLTIKASRLMLNICTSWAYVHIKKLIVRNLPVESNLRVSGLLRQSVEAGIRSIAASECVATGCTGCGDLVCPTKDKPRSSSSFGKHLPLYDQAVSMHNVCDNLIQIPRHLWPPHSVTFIKRYMPILHVKFGKSRVEDMEEKIIQEWETATCVELPSK